MLFKLLMVGPHPHPHFSIRECFKASIYPADELGGVERRLTLGGAVAWWRGGVCFFFSLSPFLQLVLAAMFAIVTRHFA
jgi:hypothetical protein